MEDPVTLWHVPQSRSFRVLWFLHEAGIPHRVERMSFAGKALRDPAYLAISPAGRVPAVQVDGRTMFESGAILEWLCETRAPALGREPGHPERASWLEWLHYAETIGQHLAQLTQQHIVLREDWMRSPTVMKLEAMRLSRVLAGVGAAVQAQDWLLPSGFSAVDVGIGYGVHLASRFVDVDALPGLAAYHARLTARPAFQAAQAADGPAEIYTRDRYEVPDV
jgi:glutathione S-transferase